MQYAVQPFLMAVIFWASLVSARAQDKPAVRQFELQPNSLDVVANGALCNVEIVEFHPISIAAGSPNLTLRGGWFKPADVGKLIVIIGAGPARQPLATTIRAVKGVDAVELAVSANTSIDGNNWLAYGNDDAPAINAAIKSLPTGKGASIDFPSGICGIGAPIQLPQTWGNLARSHLTLRGKGRGVSVLIALAHIGSILHEASGWHQQAHLSELGLEAAGIADYALHIEGGYGGQYREMDFADGAVASLRIGSNLMNKDGTVSGEWYTPVDEVQLMQSSATVQSNMFPQGLPPYAILVQGGDSHFFDVVAHGAAIANIRETSAANNFYTAVHSYGPARYAYWIHGHASFTNCEVDGSLEAGVRSDGGDFIWLGGRMFFPKQPTEEVFAFRLEGDNHRSLLGGAIIDDLPPDHFIRIVNGVSPSGDRINLR